MSSKEHNLLLVDDDADVVLSLTRALKNAGVDAKINAATGLEKTRALLASDSPAVCVIDLSIEPKRGVESGFELLSEIRMQLPETRIIVLTGHGSTESGVRALQLGAANFLQKPADVPHLAALIRDGFTQADLMRDYRRMAAAQSSSEDRGLVGTSAAVEAVREAIRYASQTSQSVLILGETGTGKGLCASMIHRQSSRKHAQFVRYQPTFSNLDLVNSDLFGHTKGSFTGAQEDRKGLVAEADRGTLFLDEIDELPVETQVTLLGVLQEKRYRVLGSNRLHDVDFRLVCAMNRPVEQRIEEGKLRRDFYHRIAHFTITLPPLRERLDDIPLLAHSILEQFKNREQIPVFHFANSALDTLRSSSWPGNIRELEAVVEGGAYRAHFGGRSTIESTDLTVPETKTDQLPSVSTDTGSFHDLVEAYKLTVVQDALARNGGNQVRAAEALKMDRSSMRRILGRKS